ncbi:MAG: hypothetical protein HS122_10565 [Opitutaceae bacterium]|nr:hypothetical protein [Opitutaceae bacterium]
MSRFIVFAVIFCLTNFAQDSRKVDYVPIYPTVFFLSREAFPFRDGRTSRPTLENVGRIIQAARNILILDDSEYFENIIILDEGNSWFVSFQAVGNGNVRKRNSERDANDSALFSLNTNAGIYLDKETLTLAKRGPEKPIRSLPMISPAGERNQGHGYVFGPGYIPQKARK